MANMIKVSFHPILIKTSGEFSRSHNLILTRINNSGENLHNEMKLINDEIKKFTYQTRAEMGVKWGF